MMANEENARFIGGAMARTTAWRAWATITGGWVLQGFGQFSVIEKTSGDWLGRVGPWMPEGWPGTEVGWALVRRAWGKGYATEAAAATIDWVFDHLGWSEVIHCIESVNAPSIAVATRLGSTLLRQQHLPPPHDHILSDIYGQSRAQWRARRPG